MSRLANKKSKSYSDTDDFEYIGKESLPSDLNNTFNKRNIESIYVSFRRGILSGKWNAYGSIEFKNCNTSGEQKFDGATFDEVVVKIKAFLNEL